jgi:hypothetical protein
MTVPRSAGQPRVLGGGSMGRQTDQPHAPCAGRWLHGRTDRSAARPVCWAVAPWEGGRADVHYAPAGLAAVQCYGTCFRGARSVTPMWLLVCAAAPLPPPSVFVTHLHGDHCFGLPSLVRFVGVARQAAGQLEEPLRVYGPPGDPPEPWPSVPFVPFCFPGGPPPFVPFCFPGGKGELCCFRGHLGLYAYARAVVCKEAPGGQHLSSPGKEIGGPHRVCLSVCHRRHPGAAPGGADHVADAAADATGADGVHN